MLKKRKILLVMMSLCLSLFAQTAVFADSSINSARIIMDTIHGMSSCMHYRIVGLCFWQKTWYSAPTETLKLDQYLPDDVVSVYTKPINNPWWFARQVVDPLAYKMGQAELKYFTGDNLGYGDEHDRTNNDIDDRFHEVDMIGNPALAVLNHSNVMLRSAATPYMPNYLSLLDAYAWRFPLLERFYPGSIIPGLHDVGMIVLHDWGPIYPRTGFVAQVDDAKAAAVVALRATTIVTRFGQPHLYTSLSNSCGVNCYAHAVKENDKNAQYQMIYPIDKGQCMVFGKSDITSLQPWGMDAAKKGNHRYVWILWRHYHGCVQGKGAYIGSIDF